MNNMRNKILMTLALLITAVGGAWAKDDKPATPVISGETEFYDEVTVTITCATSDANIYYTLDGSDPTYDGPSSTEIEYKNAFTLTETTTVRAAAYTGMLERDCRSDLYQADRPQGDLGRCNQDRHIRDARLRRGDSSHLRSCG